MTEGSGGQSDGFTKSTNVLFTSRDEESTDTIFFLPQEINPLFRVLGLPQNFQESTPAPSANVHSLTVHSTTTRINLKLSNKAHPLYSYIIQYLITCPVVLIHFPDR